MSRKALRKDFYMEIRRSLGRFLSIFFIVAIGVAFFSGIRSAEPDMRLSGDAYFDKNNLMDIKIVSTLGLTGDDVKALEKVKGIEKAEAGYSEDALCSVNDSEKVVHISSILPTINKVTAEKGRLPKAPDECLVDEDFLKGSGYKIGDKLTFSSGTDKDIKKNLKTNTFTIVGIGSSPCYISLHRGSSTIGTGTVSGFVYVPAQSFTMDAYTEIYAKAGGAGELTAFTKDYDKRISAAIGQVKKIRGQRENARYQEIVDKAQKKLDDAKKELKDSKDQAQKQLAQAKAKLDDGRAQLAQARTDISNGYAQLKDFQNTLEQKQEEVNQGYAALNAQTDALNGKREELKQAKARYDALASGDQTDEQTQTAIKQLGDQIAEGQAQTDSATSQIDQARGQLDEGRQQINEGLAQAKQAQADLAKGQNEITAREQDLKAGQADYDKARAEADSKIAEGEKKIQSAQDDIGSIAHAKWYINDRSILPEYSSYGENADRMKAIGQVFPVLFFLVAALISLTTMTRMVEEQRIQIGTLKALGYERRSIAAKYIGYACLATVGGSAFGILVGEKILPYIIITAYGIIFRHMHELRIPYNMYYGLFAALAALACTLSATLFSCFHELHEQAAGLMRPPTPKQGKRVFLERMPFLWKRLSFIWKATVRNLIRYKKRFFMTVFGIGGSMALLLVGFGLKDSIFDIAALQYGQIQHYDGNVILKDDASQKDKDDTYGKLSGDSRVKDTAENLLTQVEVAHGKKNKDVYLNVPRDVKVFSKLVTFRNRITHEKYKLGGSGAILTEKMARMLDVKVGDTVYIKDTVKGKVPVKIENICENYMGHYLYLSPALYKQLYKKSPPYNSIYFAMKKDNSRDLEKVGESVLETKGALSVSYTSTMHQQLDDMLGSLNIVMIVLVISAGMLAFVVLYNLNNINITERKRELATLKVLGFFDKEVSAYVYRENIILTLIGSAAGIAMGILLHKYIIVTVEIDSAMFGRNINFTSFVYSFLITLGFSFFVNGVMYFKLRKIDMVESLKSVE